jgi:hypothetical protein
VIPGGFIARERGVVVVDSSGRSADEALGRELNANAVREMALVVQLTELERNRWAAFSIVELEWISGAGGPAGDGNGGELSMIPGEANAELERRSRTTADG